MQMQLRRVSWLMVCALVLVFLAGQGRANAAVVLLLSTGSADEDAAVQARLGDLGHQVDIGPPFYQFDGTDVNNYDTVLLLPNYNYFQGDMPVAGQMALRDFVSAGHGLVTTEWTVWMIGATLKLTTLSDAIPVVATAAYRASATATYTSVTPDDILNAGVDPVFTFMADNFAGTETSFVPKDGATIFYASDFATDAGGLIGWGYGAGRVISFSTLGGLMEVADSNYGQLLSNAATWSTNPQ
jgi:hypothetical protein